MTKNSLERLVIVALLASASCFAETAAEIRTRVLTQTKLAYTSELKVPVAEYKGDGDPTTLEIVSLKSAEDGPSRVSDDGEVIFLAKADIDDKTLTQSLFRRAFEIRIARAVRGT